ncbi:universal stress protein [Solimonas terrae]|uniref:Universal stress protein n=1 Tax=Solimonas terrae TaxID=1396819 RepID=A0A6M2BST2_9GAMM|nr:universal stress protein [Solimonas terrae]NGY05295.1 universal stress protein [Solimonas terrae]
MATYNHILVALALDQSGRLVLKRACALAELFGARLSVLHVVEYIPIESGELLMTAPVDLTQQLEQQSRQQLEAICAECSIAAENVHTATGPVTPQIQQLAEALQIDLIVLGHQPRHGLAAWFNHTEENVITRARCDVLAVHVG